MINYNPNQAVDPEDTYLCAIQFMYDLALGPWEGTIPSGFEAYSEGVNGLKVAFGSLSQPDDEQQLQNKHLVLGLLAVMNKIASRNIFCNTRATLYIYYKAIGRLAIGRPILPDPNWQKTSGTNVTLTDIDPVAKVIANRSLTFPKEIVDPDDSDFVISYEMLDDPIPCQALLNAALSGLANSAVMSNDDRCTNFAGLSSSGEVTYMIGSNPPGTATFILTYSLVKRTLKLLPARMYRDGTCGEVKFDFIYRGEELGGGSIFLS